MIHWSKKQAREYLVKYHMINTYTSPTIEDVFHHLHTIQVDPLDVVGRNADLVLQARIKGYKKYDVYKSLYQDRFIMDGWDKMMAIIKTDDYPKLQHVRDHRAEGEKHTLNYRLQISALDYVDDVLNLIKEEGPL